MQLVLSVMPYMTDIHVNVSFHTNNRAFDPSWPALTAVRHLPYVLLMDSLLLCPYCAIHLHPTCFSPPPCLTALRTLTAFSVYISPTWLAFGLVVVALFSCLTWLIRSPSRLCLQRDPRIPDIINHVSPGRRPPCLSQLARAVYANNPLRQRPPSCWPRWLYYDGAMVYFYE